jgi:predicted nucleotidyltransferase component of viral defense system
MEVLAPQTRDLLDQYFLSGPGRESFYLGGGTALSLADFQHRRSDDLDLFSRDSQAVSRFGVDFNAWGNEQGFRVEEDLTRRSDTFRRFYFWPANEPVKIEIIADTPPFFGPVRERAGIRCENLRTLFASKLVALVGREEVKDLVDAFFIFRHSGQDRAGLVQDAMEKTGGLTAQDIALRLLRFATAKTGEFLSNYMIRSVSAEELKEFCQTEGEILRNMSL